MGTCAIAHSQPHSDQGPPKRRRPSEPLPATDLYNRPYDLHLVVVNFANVGSFYGIKVLGHTGNQPKLDWEGVRRCVRHLKFELGLKVVGVIFENFTAPDNNSSSRVPMPTDIRAMCDSI